MAQAVAAIKLKPSWERIEFWADPPPSYSLTLHYKSEAAVPTQSAAEADTKGIARAVLVELLREGKPPTEEQIWVNVFAWQAVRGETGKTPIRWLGVTSYHYWSDRLEFSP
jgi:hypothetical protein